MVLGAFHSSLASLSRDKTPGGQSHPSCQALSFKVLRAGSIMRRGIFTSTGWPKTIFKSSKISELPGHKTSP